MKAICVICTERFSDNADMSVCKCGHIFHQNCITRWLRAGLDITCPQCRQPLNPIQIIHGLFFSEDAGEDENETEKRELRENLLETQAQLEASESCVQNV
jgi:hypothetical protein